MKRLQNVNLIGKKETIKERKRPRNMVLLPKVAVIIVTVFWLSSSATSVPNTNVTAAFCNVGVYSKGYPFGISLEYVVEELETVTPTRKSYDYFNVSPYPNAFAYGHATCNQNLTGSDCTSCLGAAKTTMFGSCQSRIGARALLHDCTIRYEQYPFAD